MDHNAANTGRINERQGEIRKTRERFTLFMKRRVNKMTVDEEFIYERKRRHTYKQIRRVDDHGQKLERQ